jgi:hypothetical protein
MLNVGNLGGAVGGMATLSISLGGRKGVASSTTFLEKMTGIFVEKEVC